MQSASALRLDSQQRKEFDLSLGRYRLKLGEATKIMGILNVTGDSFSNDGIYQDPERARARALEMIAEGADIIDVGGESTRPGAQEVCPEEELRRVLPVIKKLNKEINLPISIDTSKSEVAQAALEEGASIVNDISGLRFDPKMPQVIARFGAGCVLMHIKGTPRTMQNNPFYASLIEEIIGSLKQSITLATSAGIDRNKIVVDPGIGFGKSTEHNLEIVNRLGEFSCLDLPILVGTSRKSFIGNVLKAPVEERLWGTAATVTLSIINGAHIVRVHDVKEMAQVVKMTDAVLKGC